MKLSAQIQRNAEAAVSILNDLLNYDKIQMGMLKLELSLVPLVSNLTKTVNEFKIAALEKSVTLTLDFSGLQQGSEGADDGGADLEGNKDKAMESFKVVADNIRIAQVMRNLISNALKFSAENGTY